MSHKLIALCITGGAATTPHIPLYNVLWVETTDTVLRVNYATSISKNRLAPAHLEYALDRLADTSIAQTWASKLMQEAYKGGFFCPRSGT